MAGGVQLQILQNSLLEIGIPCTEIRGDPLTDPLQDGRRRTYRTVGVLEKGAIHVPKLTIYIIYQTGIHIK